MIRPHPDVRSAVSILGLGIAKPDHSISQADAAEMLAVCCGADARQARTVPNLFRRTTVRRRYSTLLRPNADQTTDASSMQWFYAPRVGDGPGPTTAARMSHFRARAAPLAEAACRRAMDNAGVGADRVTHLVTVTCTGFAAPGVDIALVKRLALSRSVKRTQIGFMGCHAALNALQVAQSIAAADPAARVLVVCVELCSLHFQYGLDAQSLVSNALFADGAAAIIVGQTAGDAPALWRIIDTASSILDDSEDQMTWHVGDHGFEMTLSSAVPQTVGRHVRSWLTRWLAPHDLSIEAVGSWAVHPGGPRIVTEVAGHLGLAETAVEVSRDVLRDHGNMSSATVLFILDRLRARGARPPCVMMSFGPGLVAEAALLG